MYQTKNQNHSQVPPSTSSSSRPSSRNAQRTSVSNNPNNFNQSSSRSNSRRSSVANIHHSSQAQPDPYAFCNSFWGESGYETLTSKTRQSTRMLDDLRVWYRERAAIEDEYAKRLARLSKSPLLDGDQDYEVGGMRRALEVVRETTKQSAHSHTELAGTIRTALEKKVSEFITRREGLKKNPQALIERLYKKKTELTEITEKTRRKYEADAIAVNGLSAQTHLVQGRDFDKISAKLDKAQQNVQMNEREYRMHLKNLKETTAEWNIQWKSYCDLAQDLEEDRMDFIRTSFWDYANGVSTICVVDDEQCESIRKALERCETTHDVVEFVRHARTGNDIYVAPDYVNYARGEQTPYGRPQPMMANFVRSSTRNPRSVPATTSIQDLAHAIRSGPSSPTDTIPPTSVRSSSKAAVKRGGAIADAVAANSYANDSTPGLVPKPSLSRASVGSSISRAASPAEAMAQVLGGGSAGSTNSRGNGHQANNSSGGGPPVTPASANPSSYLPPQHHSSAQFEASSAQPEAAPPPSQSTRPTNRYIPASSSSESAKRQQASQQRSHSPNPATHNHGQALPPPSNRPASRASTAGSVHPPSVPAENGTVDPLVAALEKLRSTPSISSFRKSPAPGAHSRNGSANPTSRRGTLEQPPSNDQYKRASSPAPSAVMMKPPANVRSNGGRSPSPQPNQHYPRNTAPSPSPSGRSEAPSYHQSSSMHQDAQQRARHQSYAGPPSSSGNPRTGSSMDESRGGVTEASGSATSRGARLAQQISHNHTRSQPNSSMAASPSPYGKPDPNPVQFGQQQHQAVASQSHHAVSQQQAQHPPRAAQPQAGYQTRPPQYYGYAPPPSTTPAPPQSYPSQGHVPNSQSHYSIPPSHSFSSQQPPQQPPQQPYYAQSSTPITNPPAAGMHNHINGVQRASSMYDNQGQQPQHQQQHAPPSQQQQQQQPYYSQTSVNQPAQPQPPQSSSQNNQAPSPTGTYTESGLPILFYVRALYDYSATMPEEFSFQANDIIAITQTDPDGWWQGELLDEDRRRRSGGGNVLPSNFVELLN